MDPILIGEILAGLMFVGVVGVLMLGFPVAFSLAGTALIFGLVGWWLGVYDPSNYGSLAGRYFGLMTNEVLVAVPLFVFMGVMLERSGIAEQLLLTMGKLFGNMRGGLGLSVIVISGLMSLIVLAPRVAVSADLSFCCAAGVSCVRASAGWISSGLARPTPTLSSAGSGQRVTSNGRHAHVMVWLPSASC